MQENKIYFKKTLIVFIVSRLILYSIYTLVYFVYNKEFILDILTTADGKHYLNIALNGYSINEKSLYAFFPLFPLIIKLFNFLNIKIIGTIIFNNIISLLNCYLFYKIGKLLNIKENNIYIITSIYILSPIMFFETILYTEPIIIFLTLSTYYLYYKNNKKLIDYILLGLSLGLNVFAKSIGSVYFFIIFVAIFIKFIKKQEKLFNIIITYSIATLISIIYPIYLYVKTGNLFYFIDVQFKYWNRIKSNIFYTIYLDIKTILVKDSHFTFTNIITFIINYLILGIIVYLIIKNIKNKNVLLLNLTEIIFILALFSTCRYYAEFNKNLPSFSFFRYYLSCPMFYFLINTKQEKIIKNIFFYLMIFIMFFLFSGFPLY
jgi:4-amino-4-deoxy-L-arabinose transferase-like glycosyltransferase